MSNNIQTDGNQCKLAATGKKQKFAKTVPHHLLEALGSRIAREAPDQNQAKSAKLLIARSAEKRRKSGRTEPSQQGFQDRRRSQNENWRRQNRIENAGHQPQSENAKHQNEQKIWKKNRGALFSIFLCKCNGQSLHSRAQLKRNHTKIQRNIFAKTLQFYWQIGGKMPLQRRPLDCLGSNVCQSHAWLMYNMLAFKRN